MIPLPCSLGLQNSLPFMLRGSSEHCTGEGQICREHKLLHKKRKMFSRVHAHPQAAAMLNAFTSEP
jgi:hypothetical protein